MIAMEHKLEMLYIVIVIIIHVKILYINLIILNLLNRERLVVVLDYYVLKLILLILMAIHLLLHGDKKLQMQAHTMEQLKHPILQKINIINVINVK